MRRGRHSAHPDRTPPAGNQDVSSSAAAGHLLQSRLQKPWPVWKQPGPGLRGAVEGSDSPVLMPGPWLHPLHPSPNPVPATGLAGIGVSWVSVRIISCRTVLCPPALALTFLQGPLHPLRADRVQGRAFQLIQEGGCLRWPSAMAGRGPG